MAEALAERTPVKTVLFHFVFIRIVAFPETCRSLGDHTAPILFHLLQHPFGSTHPGEGHVFESGHVGGSDRCHGRIPQNVEDARVLRRGGETRYYREEVRVAVRLALPVGFAAPCLPHGIVTACEQYAFERVGFLLPIGRQRFVAHPFRERYGALLRPPPKHLQGVFLLDIDPVDEEPADAVGQNAVLIAAAFEYIEGFFDARPFALQVEPVAEEQLVAILCDQPPERVVGDVVDVGLCDSFAAEHCDRAPYDLPVGKRVGVYHHAHRQVARPRQAVALDAVHQEFVHAEAQRVGAFEPNVVEQCVCGVEIAPVAGRVGVGIACDRLYRGSVRQVSVAERHRRHRTPKAFAGRFQIEALFTRARCGIDCFEYRFAGKELRLAVGFQYDKTEQLPAEIVEGVVLGRRLQPDGRGFEPVRQRPVFVAGISARITPGEAVRRSLPERVAGGELTFFDP